MRYRMMWLCLAFVLLNVLTLVGAAPAEENGEAAADPLAGHSAHGEAFNEGPRQAARLIEGTGKVDFPVTTDDPLAQQFIEQGVGQLHGFWYFEAERSFRQAAAIDPGCAMSYWGMAMANLGNEKRAKGFIAKAVERKSSASEREQMYIDAVNDYIQADSKKKKERAEKYTEALENLLHKYPDDVEARALLALQLWNNRSAGIPISSHLAIDALLQQVFDVEPMHPAHHYRIHLWDVKRAETALTSAARCGQAAPSIAHMWHMPGHIFSRLKRYDDAAWQQEASARTDHANMMRDGVMPDQIHNFAHNNEWLIRNLNNVGRVRDAVDLAKNMIELPQHPKYNTLKKKGSAYYGRLRLFDTLRRYELWEEVIALCDSPYLPPTDTDSEQLNRLRRLGEAHYRSGDVEQGDALLAEVETLLQQENANRDQAAAEAETKAKQAARDQKAIDEAIAAAEQEARDNEKNEDEIAQVKSAAETKAIEDAEKKNEKEIDKAIADAKKRFASKIRNLEKARDELRGHQAAAGGDYAAALPLLKKSGGAEPLYLALVQFLAGERDEALAAAQKQVDSNQNEVHPLACQIDLLWRSEKHDEAKAAFEKLRNISGSVDVASSPVFTRLSPIAEELGYESDWRTTREPRDDVGERPELDQLGPFRWQPSPAPDWTLPNSAGEQRSLVEFRGRPVIVVFYLGYGCLHCAEQLQALAPKIGAFREAGIELVAVSSDDQAGLQISLKNYGQGDLPIPLLANPELDVFRSYRAYDDFEDQPLHGTFLIDAAGMVRWQDISYEPFMDVEFLLAESKRLLAQTALSKSQPVVKVD